MVVGCRCRRLLNMGFVLPYCGLCWVEGGCAKLLDGLLGWAGFGLEDRAVVIDDDDDDDGIE